jgi:hypothetical protein
MRYQAALRPDWLKALVFRGFDVKRKKPDNRTKGKERHAVALSATKSPTQSASRFTALFFAFSSGLPRPVGGQTSGQPSSQAFGQPSRQTSNYIQIILQLGFGGVLNDQDIAATKIQHEIVAVLSAELV